MLHANSGEAGEEHCSFEITQTDNPYLAARGKQKIGPRECGQMWGTHTRAEPGNDFKSSIDNHQSSMESIGHDADFFFHLSGVHHGDGIPGAAVEEGAVRTLAGAL